MVLLDTKVLPFVLNASYFTGLWAFIGPGLESRERVARSIKGQLHREKQDANEETVPAESDEASTKGMNGVKVTLCFKDKSKFQCLAATDCFLDVALVW